MPISNRRRRKGTRIFTKKQYVVLVDVEVTNNSPVEIVRESPPLSSPTTSTSSSISTIATNPADENIPITEHAGACSCCNFELTPILRVNNNNEDEGTVRKALLMNAKSKLQLLDKCKLYKRLMKSEKLISQQREHLRMLDRANDLNGLFLKNMEAVKMLGHCRATLKLRTSGVFKGLIEVHKLIKANEWDGKLEDLFMNFTESKKTAVSTYLEFLQEKLGKEMNEIEAEEFHKFFTDEENADELPEVLRDDKKLEELCALIDDLEVDVDWNAFMENVEKRLYTLELEVTEICMEYGIRNPLPLKEFQSS